VEKALNLPDLIHLSTPSLVTAQYRATSEVVKKRRPSSFPSAMTELQLDLSFRFFRVVGVRI
jgi:hypothetical protein